ncbi:MAG: hypothetical protein LBD70_06745, partial [Bifidobacteriaceae bacterium]|nr:hypothetical protein [Bifidobacteriaceae bacterium]
GFGQPGFGQPGFSQPGFGQPAPGYSTPGQRWSPRPQAPPGRQAQPGYGAPRRPAPFFGVTAAAASRGLAARALTKPPSSSQSDGRRRRSRIAKTAFWFALLWLAIFALGWLTTLS